jgi:hypothetical protein
MESYTHTPCMNGNYIIIHVAFRSHLWENVPQDIWRLSLLSCSMLLWKESPVQQRNLLRHLGRNEGSQAKYWYSLILPWKWRQEVLPKQQKHPPKTMCWYNTTDSLMLIPQKKLTAFQWIDPKQYFKTDIACRLKYKVEHLLIILNALFTNK